MEFVTSSAVRLATQHFKVTRHSRALPVAVSLYSTNKVGCGRPQIPIRVAFRLLVFAAQAMPVLWLVPWTEAAAFRQRFRASGNATGMLKGHLLQRAECLHRKEPVQSLLR